MSSLLEMDSVARTYVAHKGLIGQRKLVRAVDDISLRVTAGETLGIVGESGSGKSTLGRMALGLERPDAGLVTFDGAAMPAPGTVAWRALRRRMQMVFQDPLGALDRRLPVLEQITEPLVIHAAAGDHTQAGLQALAAVGLSAEHGIRYPHELSGGQRQRVVIARALITDPELLVCDEPVSALDVSIQAQVLNLLSQLQRDFGLTYLFISHDLSVVRYVSDRVAVMYLGRIVELADTAALFEEPRHPYTAALLSAIPVPDPTLKRDGRVILSGDVPSPSNPPPGCPFHPRCTYAQDICRTAVPQLRPVARKSGRQGTVACHLADDLALAGIPTPAPQAATGGAT